MSEDDQKYQSARIAEVIREAEEKVGHTRTLVIGDLNMNPFEAGVAGAGGLHAVMDQGIAKKRSRIVQGKEKLFFYNPMWGRMGDSFPGPSGTYYYNSSKYVNYFWNIFDQVLLRPDLLDFFSHNDLKIISEIDGRSLLTQTGLSSSHSDHLPIVTKLEIERMA